MYEQSLHLNENIIASHIDIIEIIVFRIKYLLYALYTRHLCTINGH